MQAPTHRAVGRSLRFYMVRAVGIETKLLAERDFESSKTTKLIIACFCFSLRANSWHAEIDCYAGKLSKVLCKFLADMELNSLLLQKIYNPMPAMQLAA